MVERDLAKVEVASSTLVSRSSFQEVGSLQSAVGSVIETAACQVPTAYISFRRRSQVVRQRSAKPLFIGSIPIAASNLNQQPTISQTLCTT